MGICSAIMESPSMFLLTKASHTEGRPRVSGILVDQGRADDLPVESWQLGLLTESRREVRCQISSFSEISSGVDEAGRPTTFFDGEPCISDDLTEILAAAENRIELVLDPPFHGESLPVFLC